MRIVAAGNTIVPAYLVLLEKGYQVSRLRTDDEVETWLAIKAGEEFVADDPLMLLGLVSLYEIRQEVWPAPDGEIDAFMERFYGGEGNTQES